MPPNTEDEHLPVQLVVSRHFMNPALRRSCGESRGSKLDGKFRDLRTNAHDRQQENTGGNPPPEEEKFELPDLVLYTPGRNKRHKTPSGEETKTERKSWKCAYN